MAYCDIGQRECEYLTVVKSFEEELIGERLDGDQSDPVYSEFIAQAVENFKPTSVDEEFACTLDACKIVKKAVAKAIMAEAEQLEAEKELSEEHDGR
jgi:hypothetical protein